MRQHRDITGQRFGRWLVLERIGKNRHGTPTYRFQCDCGTVHEMVADNILRGTSRSCGCLNAENTATRSITHGLTGHPLYSIWANIKYRCYNSHSKLWLLYGGRGIVMCDRWRNNFAAFVADMGDRPEGTSIDRIDVNGPYSPENCRWATAIQQHRNTRTNKLLEFNGKRQTISAWAEELGVGRTVLNNRLRMGWSIEDTLTIPVGARTRWNR